MYYAIKHETVFRYSQPISESVMEVYMQPRSESIQRCLRFRLVTYPRARVSEHADLFGNTVQFFDIPTEHAQLTLSTEAIVELVAPPALPDALDADAWEVLDHATRSGDFWDLLMPSALTEQSALLAAFAEELDVRRRGDPLALLRELNQGVYSAINYTPNSTDVDSPIDEALHTRRGVCQDFAHVMTALVRRLGIPCRYVSGYLYYNKDDRSIPDASHAWVEAYLPQTGWIGFDPTNNVLAGERHIRVAVGRDYSDVPPTRGVFRGKAETELSVEVHVTQTDAPFAVESLVPVTGWQPETDEVRPQQQQQQQQ
jgi:transglutaminase-like putative cysteine protease